jgi:hypothetical protein
MVILHFESIQSVISLANHNQIYYKVDSTPTRRIPSIQTADGVVKVFEDLFEPEDDAGVDALLRVDAGPVEEVVWLFSTSAPVAMKARI